VDDDDEAAFDGIEMVEAATELIDEKDDVVVGRSEYKTSWLLADGNVVTAAADIAIADDGSNKGWVISRSLSGGTLLLGGSMA